MRRRRVGDLFEQVASLGNLFAAAKKALRGRGLEMPAVAFAADLETEVVALAHELRSASYRPGAYHYFEIFEPKRRLVAAAPFRDRVVHHAICRVIEPIWERRFIADNYACRPGKGTHAAMRRARVLARQHPWALSCDIQQYFPSVSHEVLMSTITRVIADERLLRLIRLILASHVSAAGGCGREVRPECELGGACGGTGLPIGNLTSQFFANVMLDPFDHFVTEVVRPSGYVRYMDDFLVFGQSRGELRAIGTRLRDRLAGLELAIHPDKYRLIRTASGVDFVGFTVFADGRIRLREKSLKNFRRRYRRLLAGVQRGHVKPASVTASVKSWVAHARHAHSEPLRAALLGRPRKSGITGSEQAGRGGGRSGA
jgi:RNA-directed DNA polymerase